MSGLHSFTILKTGDVIYLSKTKIKQLKNKTNQALNRAFFMPKN